MSKKVYKYATGQAVPEGAVYLSTQVEKKTEIHNRTPDNFVDTHIENNILVWHYFLVEVGDE